MAEKEESAVAQLLIELTFLVPKGTYMGPDSSLGKALLAYRNAVREAAKKTE